MIFTTSCANTSAGCPVGVLPIILYTSSRNTFHSVSSISFLLSMGAYKNGNSLSFMFSGSVMPSAIEIHHFRSFPSLSFPANNSFSRAIVVFLPVASKSFCLMYASMSSNANSPAVCTYS